MMEHPEQQQICCSTIRVNITCIASAVVAFHSHIGGYELVLVLKMLVMEEGLVLRQEKFELTRTRKNLLGKKVT